MTDRGEQLKAFIAALPERELKSLAAKVELDRGENKFGIPHEAIMILLRPRLAEMRAPRVYTAQRMLCLPFEDLLTFEDPDPKIAGTIARASISAMWSLLMDRIQPEWEGVSEAFLEAQRKGNEEAVKSSSAQLWNLAARSLKEWDASLGNDPGEIRTAAKKIGGTRRLEDIREMSMMLEVAESIEFMKDQLPRKPILGLNAEQVTLIKRLYETVSDESPDHEIYLILALIGRLSQPFPVLKVFRAISPKLDDTIEANKNLVVAGDIVIGALEKDASSVAEIAREENATDIDVVAKAKRFADAFKGITSDIGIRRDGEWGQRMYGCRSKVSEAIENLVLSTAQDVVLEVLPKKGKAAPSFAEFPDEAAFISSERRARALADTARIADEIGLQYACQSAVNQLRKDLDQYGAKIIESLPKVDESKKEEAGAHLAVTVRLIELIENSDTADLLRRRGNAALTNKTIS